MECAWPYATDAKLLAQAVREAGVQFVLVNTLQITPRDRTVFLAMAYKDMQGEFDQSLDQALSICHGSGVSQCACDVRDQTELDE